MELINFFWILPLIYLGLYSFFVIAKSSKSIFIGEIDLLDKLIFCTVCFAWFFALLIGIIYNYPKEIIIFQIGMSVTGIAMYIREELHAKKQKFIFDFFLYQIVFTIIGLLIIYFIVK